MSARRSLAQFQSFLLVLLQLGAEISWRRDELSAFLYSCTIDSVRVSECPVKKCVPSFLTQVSSGSRLINITFVMKIVYGGWLHQPMRKKGTIHTIISCRMDIYSRKTCSDLPNSSFIHQFLGLSIIPFRIENGISVLIDPSKKTSRCWNAFRVAN